MTRDDLIAALERAERPSRELDAAISAVTGVLPGFPRPLLRDKPSGHYHYVSPATFEAREDGSVDCFVNGHRVERHAAPNWTASVDSALTLVPDGCQWELDWHAHLGWDEGTDGPASASIWKGRQSGEWGASARTPALALCAAALRARTAP